MMLELASPILTVADVVRPSPEPFAVFAVYPDRPLDSGGCEAVCVSLHMTREEADRVVLGSGSYTDTAQ